jgi:hypothetical protein
MIWIQGYNKAAQRNSENINIAVIKNNKYLIFRRTPQLAIYGEPLDSPVSVLVLILLNFVVSRFVSLIHNTNSQS